MKRLLVGLLAVAVPLTAAPATDARPKLRRFNSCGQLVQYGKSHRPGYQPGGPPPPFTPTPVMGAPGPAADGAGGAPTAAPEAGGGDVSHTNTQEAGVFEPDIVKTDGKHVYAVTSAGVLEIVDVTGTPKLVAELGLPAGANHQLLRHGDQLLVAVSTFGAQNQTVLASVDASDPAHPVLTRTLTVNGDLLAERRTNNTVRVVLSIAPRAIAYPDQPVSNAPRAWLPRGRFADLRRHTSSRRTLVGCRHVRRPRSFSGLEELTVLTIDLDKGLDPVDADAVMTSGGTVYASAKNLFVATQRYEPALAEQTTGPAPEGQTTQIHRFSLDDADNTTYRGSGSIPGFVLNQFSLSEQGAVLRVASTDVPPWFTEGDPSHSLVTTLAENADHLETLGQVDGLGQGERIFAVRFLGDAGYVVTFRQVDPLFTIDLSDPAHPVKRGELELSGVSSYLHPIAGDRLIGVGNGPSDDGTANGLQLSEFDVSDLAHPALQQRVTVDGGSSEVTYDHHAFLWWAPRDLAVLPVSIYHYESPPCDPGPCPAYAQQVEGFTGAIGWTVTPAAITEAGRVSHPNGVVRRSIIKGDRLLTVSDAGLQASTLDGYADVGFAAFSAAPSSGGGSSPPGGVVSPPPP
ncbi:MAG: hypothetical protein QOI80_1772 [Solirubrobacteraceae bacterium]|jgi:hypothetical protein|nr:hypothetical protein [Solirubrobacteraceae bacterium]